MHITLQTVTSVVYVEREGIGTQTAVTGFQKQRNVLSALIPKFIGVTLIMSHMTAQPVSLMLIVRHLDFQLVDRQPDWQGVCVLLG